MDFNDSETGEGFTSDTGRGTGSEKKKRNWRLILIIAGAAALILIIILVCVFATGGGNDKPIDTPQVLLSKTPTGYQNQSFTISWKTHKMQADNTTCTLEGDKFRLSNLTAESNYTMFINKPGLYSFTMDCVQSSGNASANLTVHAQIQVEVLSVFSAGSGTIQDPLVVQNCYDLQNIHIELDAHYILTKDIDCHETRDWNNRDGFLSIGQGHMEPFTGSINGQGHSIFELFIGRSDYCFLKNNGGTISYLNFHNAYYNVTYGEEAKWVGGVACFNKKSIHDVLFEGYFGKYGNPSYVGGLVAINHDSGDITLGGAIVDVRLQLKSTSVYVGTLVGHNHGKINATLATGTIELNITDKSVVSYPSSSASASNAAYLMIGGLVGGSSNGSIELSHAAGRIELTTKKPVQNHVLKIGGLVGSLRNTTVIRSYSVNDILVNSELGSLVGGLIGDTDESSEIKNCYSRSNIGGNLRESGEKAIAAGLVASLKGKVVNCFYAGKKFNLKANYIGGLLGDKHDPGKIENSYWDKEFSGIGGSRGGDGKNTKDMYKQTNYKNWNFDTIWKIEEGKAYPALKTPLD